MKLNVSGTESNWDLWKNVKTCVQNKKLYLVPPSRHGHCHPILILPVKMVELPQQTAICRYYCPLVVNHTITNSCKELHLKCGRVPRSVFETLPCMKSSPVLCQNHSFFLLFWNVATFIERHCVYLCYFLQYDEVLFKVKILVKE